MYFINIDQTKCHVAVAFSAAMFTVGGIESYITAFNSRFAAEIGDRPYTLLIDLSNSPMQKHEVAGALSTQIEGFPVARRTAVVVGQSGVKLQARRLLDCDGTRFFETWIEAETWLAAERLCDDEGRAAA